MPCRLCGLFRWPFDDLPVVHSTEEPADGKMLSLLIISVQSSVTPSLVGAVHNGAVLAIPQSSSKLADQY
jgi:hypothetical protein